MAYSSAHLDVGNGAFSYGTSTKTVEISLSSAVVMAKAEPALRKNDTLDKIDDLSVKIIRVR